MKDDGNEFFFMNKGFKTLDDLLQYEAQWNKLRLDQQSAHYLANYLAKDLVLNAMISCKLTNQQFKRKIEEIFIHAMKVLRND